MSLTLLVLFGNISLIILLKDGTIKYFGEPIEECYANPITGFFRDGFCRTDEMDEGYT